MRYFKCVKCIYTTVQIQQFTRRRHGAGAQHSSNTFMPMKNISTPVKPTLSLKERRKPKPSLRTLNLVRQFARAYQSTRISLISGLPGVVMN